MARGPLLNLARVRLALIEHEGNRVRAARALGCERSPLLRFIARYGLAVEFPSRAGRRESTRSRDRAITSDDESA